MADENYDVAIGNRLAVEEEKWRYRQRLAGYRPTLLKRLPTDVTNHIRYA